MGGSEQARAQRPVEAGAFEGDTTDPNVPDAGQVEAGAVGVDESCFARRLVLYSGTLPGVHGVRRAHGIAKVTGDTVDQVVRISTAAPRLAIKHVTHRAVSSQVEFEQPSEMNGGEASRE